MFQFTHPGRGATELFGTENLSVAGFNSRTPGGVRPHSPSDVDALRLFQFTHPGRGATSDVRPCSCALVCFNSRTPGGVRLGKTDDNLHR